MVVRRAGKQTKSPDPQHGLRPESENARAAAAKNLIDAGVDELSAMRLVGWESIAMLKRYNIKSAKSLRRSVTKLCDYIGRPHSRRTWGILSGLCRRNAGF